MNRNWSSEGECLEEIHSHRTEKHRGDRMNRRSLVLVPIVVFGTLLLAFQTAGADPTFTSTTVSKQEPSAEPSLALDNSATATNGTIYYIGPNATALFISTDGGSTFNHGPAVDDFGDADVAVDAAGNVFTSALLDT